MLSACSLAWTSEKRRSASRAKRCELTDKRAPNEPSQPRTRGGIYERGPDHVSGDSVAIATDVQRNAARQTPQHANEADEQQCRLEEPYAKLRREFGQTTRILVDALIGIGRRSRRIARRAARPESSTRRSDPGQPFARLDLDHLAEPRLRDVQHERPPAIITKIINWCVKAPRLRCSIAS